MEALKRRMKEWKNGVPMNLRWNEDLQAFLHRRAKSSGLLFYLPRGFFEDFGFLIGGVATFCRSFKRL